MSEEETVPEFKFDADHKFVKGEKIYVIDENKYDIYEAEIQDVIDGKFKIHYPDYPQDDKTYDDSKRFLLRNDENKAIFDEQEKIRLEKEQEEEEEEEEKKEEEEKEE